MLPFVACTVTVPVMGLKVPPLLPVGTGDEPPPQATIVKSRATVAKVVRMIQRRREPAMNTDPNRAARVVSSAKGK